MYFHGKKGIKHNTLAYKPVMVFRTLLEEVLPWPASCKIAKL
jgi:hypothetical protein